MLHQETTREIIGCAMDVFNELGSGFLESVYEKAMVIALEERGLAATSQQPIKVFFRGQCVGDFFADLVVDGKVIVELKGITKITPEHKSQIINYLKATGIEVGLLINFGGSSLDYKRFTRKNENSIDLQDLEDVE